MLQESIVLGDGGSRHTDTLRALIDAGANVNLPDRNGTTPLSLARSRGYKDMVGMLERAGGRSSARGTVHDSARETYCSTPSSRLTALPLVCEPLRRRRMQAPETTNDWHSLARGLLSHPSQPSGEACAATVVRLVILAAMFRGRSSAPFFYVGAVGTRAGGGAASLR